MHGLLAYVPFVPVFSPFPLMPSLPICHLFTNSPSQCGFPLKSVSKQPVQAPSAIPSLPSQLGHLGLKVYDKTIIPANCEAEISLCSQERRDREAGGKGKKQYSTV